MLLQVHFECVHTLLKEKVLAQLNVPEIKRERKNIEVKRTEHNNEMAKTTPKNIE